MKGKTRKTGSRLLLLSALLLFVSIGALAQNITIKGNVVDSYGEPVIGATVMEKVIKLMGLLLTWTVISL